MPRITTDDLLTAGVVASVITIGFLFSRKVWDVSLVPRIKYFNERVQWPLWALGVMFLAHMLMVTYSPHGIDNLFNRYMAIGDALVSIRYIWGWRTKGERFDYLIYVMTGLFMPFVVSFLFACAVRIANE